MKLVHRLVILQSTNIFLMVLGISSMTLTQGCVWVLVVGLVNLLQLYILVIIPIDKLVNMKSFDEDKSFDMVEVDKVYERIHNLQIGMDKTSENLSQMTYVSLHDQLTGCYNRFKLDDMQKTYNTYSRLYVSIFDINNLKKMNDTFGHRAGDSLICTAAKKLQFWSKHGDLYRIGGDEFLVVVYNLDESRCIELMDEFEKTNTVLNRNSDPFKCILSHGEAFGDDLDQLMKVADNRMYEDKERRKREFGEEVK